MWIKLVVRLLVTTMMGWEVSVSMSSGRQGEHGRILIIWDMFDGKMLVMVHCHGPFLHQLNSIIVKLEFI